MMIQDLLCINLQDGLKISSVNLIESQVDSLQVDLTLLLTRKIRK
jgi:hypothetical protein